MTTTPTTPTASTAGADPTADAAGPILDVAHLSVQHGPAGHPVTLVNDISFSVGAGKTIGVVGESGSGKSLTALAILRLLAPGLRQSSGTVTLLGRDLGALSPRALRDVRRDSLSAIFQDPLSSLNPTFTVGNQLTETIRLRTPGTSRRDAVDQAVTLLNRVGIRSPKERLSSYPWQLSGGMAQRVMIALAVAGGPRLLVADEPTTALDASLQLQILQLLEDMRDELHMGMMLISHDLAVIAQLADEVVVVYAGQAIERGKTADVLTQPFHPYTDALLLTRPHGDTRGQPLLAIEGRVPRGSEVLPGCRFAPRCRYAVDACREAPVPMTVIGTREVRCIRTAELDLKGLHHFAPVDPPTPAHPAAAHPVIPPLPATPARPATAAHAAAHAAAHPEADDVLLRFRGVDKRYGKGRHDADAGDGAFFALRDVTFDLRPGETLGIVGESGAGKSTIGRIATGLTDASAGAVEFVGTDVATVPNPRRPQEIRREIQIVFQNPYASLDPLMSIGDIIKEPLQAFGTAEPREHDGRIGELLDEVGLDATFAKRYPAELSGGERQRVAIARALASNPRVVVCDEPVSSLDVSMQAQVVNLLQRLQKEHGLSYLFISHDLALVRHLSHRIAVMHHGYLVELGTADQVCGSPRHPYTHNLLDSQLPFDVLHEIRVRPSRRPVAAIDEAPAAGCPFAGKCAHVMDECRQAAPPSEPTGDRSSVRCYWATDNRRSEGSEAVAETPLHAANH